MQKVLDEGPFFHGTKAALQVGDHLTAGFRSNYRPEIVMNHVYFTALRDGAGLAAELAAGDGEPRVYLVEPTGEFENDPNVTDKKFPGNPTRSYRSKEPLRIVWVKFIELTRGRTLAPLQDVARPAGGHAPGRARRDRQLTGTSPPLLRDGALRSRETRRCS
nr:NAD(+)--rifampin ADP-ribosyltransferase [Streptomyces sp. DHE17-7]